jgi:hypothetical protein
MTKLGETILKSFRQNNSHNFSTKFGETILKNFWQNSVKQFSKVFDEIRRNNSHNFSTKFRETISRFCWNVIPRISRSWFSSKSCLVIPSLFRLFRFPTSLKKPSPRRAGSQLWDSMSRHDFFLVSDPLGEFLKTPVPRR